MNLSKPLSQEARRALSELGDRFLQDFLEADLSRHPDNVEALAELGQLYTQAGLWERGLEVDRRLVQLIPDNPTAHYNLGCSQALLGLAEQALDSLEAAVEHGYHDSGFMQVDEDLANLHDHDRFRALLERLRSGS